MTFFDFLGGDRLVLNVLLLTFCFVFLSALIKNKYLKLFFAILAAVIIALQITSLYLIQSLVNYNFIIHMNSRDVFSILHLYDVGLMLFLAFLFVFLIVLFYKVSGGIVRWLKQKPAQRRKIFKGIFIALFFLSLVGMSTRKGVFPKTGELIRLFSYDNNASYAENIKALGLQKTIAISDLEVTSKNNKNIIILSLESFEKGYLSPKMAHLTPNLRKLKNSEDWSFIEINENEGSKWTSGSLYTTLTGYPAFFGGEHNHLFYYLYNSKILSVFNILNKLNHKNIYMVNDSKFSGTEDMLNALGVDEIIDEVTLGEKVMDKDLFETAKKVVTKHQKKGQKYTLYLSTLSTHNPHGIYDSRMEAFVKPQKSDIEFMASAVDFMIEDFLAFLEKNNYLKNTQIYILPDHLKHGSSEMFKGTGKRGLYLLTNVPKEKIKEKKHQNLYQLDLPKLILDLAEIKHNHTFLSEQISGDKNEFIKNHLSELTKLNISGFSNVTDQEPLIPELSKDYEKFKKDTMRFIAHGGGAIDNNMYTNSLEALNLSYKKGFRLFELDFRKTTDGKIVAVHEWEQWAGFTNSLTEGSVSYQDFMSLKILGTYSPLDMEMVNAWFSEHKDAILVTDKINTPKEFSGKFHFKDRLRMELFTWEAVEEAIANNIIPVVSENLVFALGETAGEKLKEYGIQYVAMSRYKLRNERAVFQNLKKNGIKVYAYHINSAIDKDEEYAVKYEMDYYYGIYSDNWSFE